MFIYKKIYPTSQVGNSVANRHTKPAGKRRQYELQAKGAINPFHPEWLSLL